MVNHAHNVGFSCPLRNLHPDPDNHKQQPPGPNLKIHRNTNLALQTIKVEQTRVAKMETVMAGSG